MIHLTHEQIAKKAYEIYLRSGSLPGRDQENWLAAEIELKREIETARAHATPKPNGHSSVPSAIKAQPVVVPSVVRAVTVTSHVSAPVCGCTPTPSPVPAPKAAKASKSRKTKSRF